MRVLPAYGASELPVIAVNPVDRAGEWRLDSVGLPPAGVTMRVVDLETGSVVDPGRGTAADGVEDIVAGGHDRVSFCSSRPRVRAYHW